MTSIRRISTCSSSHPCSAFYTWLHLKDDYLVYGIGTYRDKPALTCLQDSTDYLASRFGLKIERVERRTGCVVSDMPVRGNFFLGEGRMLLAGEAAGFMHVFSEGISSALLTGSLAWLAVCQADDSEESFWLFTMIWSSLNKNERLNHGGLA